MNLKTNSMNQLLKKMLLLTLFCGLIACDFWNDNKELSSTNTDEVDIKNVKRYGSVIRVKDDMLDKYKELHARPWPGVLDQISKSNIRNYSIYLKDGYLFSYFEYVGDDFESDMAKMAKDSITQEWWKLTDPCQTPIESRKKGEWWASMEEVFHHD